MNAYEFDIKLTCPSIPLTKEVQEWLEKAEEILNGALYGMPPRQEDNIVDLHCINTLTKQVLKQK